MQRKYAIKIKFITNTSSYTAPVAIYPFDVINAPNGPCQVKLNGNLSGSSVCSGNSDEILLRNVFADDYLEKNITLTLSNVKVPKHVD